MADQTQQVPAGSVMYLVILTMATPQQQQTVTRTVAVPPGKTRADLLDYARGELEPQFLGGVTLFFSIERNELAGGGER